LYVVIEDQNLAGKFGGKIWRENLAGKFGGKIWRENLAGKWLLSKSAKVHDTAAKNIDSAAVACLQGDPMSL
jgi:hypothetical protein